MSYLSWSLQHLPLCPALSRCSVNQINIPKMDLWGQGSGCGRESGWPDARVLTDSGQVTNWLEDKSRKEGQRMGLLDGTGFEGREFHLWRNGQKCAQWSQEHAPLWPLVV